MGMHLNPGDRDEEQSEQSERRETRRRPPGPRFVVEERRRLRDGGSFEQIEDVLRGPPSGGSNRPAHAQRLSNARATERARERGRSLSRSAALPSEFRQR
jgi:hypothetical protein